MTSSKEIVANEAASNGVPCMKNFLGRAMFRYLILSEMNIRFAYL